MKTNKIIGTRNWIVLYFDKKNRQIGSRKIKNKTEQDTVDEIVIEKKPYNYGGFGMYIDEVLF